MWELPGRQGSRGLVLWSAWEVPQSHPVPALYPSRPQMASMGAAVLTPQPSPSTAPGAEKSRRGWRGILLPP